VSIGLDPDKGTIDSRTSNVVIALKQVFDQVDDFQAYLTRVGTDGLQAKGYSEGEAGTMLSAFTDLAGLAQIVRGQVCTQGYGTQVATGTPVNFLAFAGQLTGMD
jgi:hypothetical protein